MLLHVVIVLSVLLSSLQALLLPIHAYETNHTPLAPLAPQNCSGSLMTQSSFAQEASPVAPEAPALGSTVGDRDESDLGARNPINEDTVIEPAAVTNTTMDEVSPSMRWKNFGFSEKFCG